MSIDSNLLYQSVRAAWPSLPNDEWISESYRKGWVTVIVPAHQRQDYVKRAALSVFAQTYRPIEFVVVDDGSTDGTAKALKEWSRKLPKDDGFEFIYEYQQNAGAPSARNRALMKSTGEFIQALDSDDLLHPRKLETNIELLRKYPECQSVWCPLQRFTDSEESRLFDRFDFTSLINESCMENASSNVFKAQFFPAVGLHRRSVILRTGPWLESLRRWQDLEYQVRLASCASQYITANQPMYFFRQHDGERVNSQYRDRRGLSSGFESLQAVRNSLTTIGHQNEKVDAEISQFYVTLATLAARCSSKHDVRRAVTEAVKFRRGTSFRFRMRVFLAIATLVSGPFAARLADVYARHR